MSKKMPSFRDYDDPKRNEPYGWDYGHGKARSRVTFKKVKDKVAYRKAFESRWYSEQHAVLSFDPAKWAEFRQLESQLDGVPIREAVEFFLKHNTGRSVPLFSVLRDARIEDLKRINSARIGHAKKYLEKFVAYCTDKKVDLYTRDEVQAWIDNLANAGLARITIRNHLAHVAKCFNDALLQGYIMRSPAYKITLPSGRGEKRVELIAPDELRRLLNHAWEHDRPMAGLLAILFFTGMRISMLAVPPKKLKGREFLRLDMINRKDKTIVIPEGIMKKERELIIDDAPECLWSWLTDIKANDFGVSQNSFNLRKNTLLDAVGVKWPPNVHRRSFGSYLAALRGRDYAAQIMADKSEGVFMKHYQVAAFKAVAKKYVEIFKD